MKNSIVADKSFNFSLRIINCYKFLCEEKRDFILSKQLLRCGTSIGANIAEALGAQSSKDFIAKLSISFKESIETEYWIRLLQASNYLDDKSSSSLLNDCIEIRKIISSILITSKKKTFAPHS